MTKIECISGPTVQSIGGKTYNFEADENGRFVCDVDNDKHVDCFLAVTAHYRAAGAAPVSPIAPVEQGDEGEEEDIDDFGEIDDDDDDEGGEHDTSEALEEATATADDDGEDEDSDEGDVAVDISKLSDADLRDHILEMTGVEPKASCKRETLEKKYRDAVAGQEG